MAATATAASAQSAREPLNEAWWTGPLLAASAGTLPPGHWLVEPYVYDAISTRRFDGQGARRPVPREDSFGSQSYINYGLANRFTVGLIPRFGYAAPSNGPHCSAPALGDVTLQAQYQLTQYREGGWLPTLSVNLGETLPTGRYDRLARASDGFGEGAYQTALALYGQTFLWAPNGRIVRARLDLTYMWSGRASVEDASVYGTAAGFRGRANPGDSAQADLAFEYSATRNWVLAVDFDVALNRSGWVEGRYPSASPVRSDLAASRAFYVAPAVEYNFSPAVGLIAGFRLEPAGRNTTATTVPVAALNMVF